MSLPLQVLHWARHIQPLTWRCVRTITSLYFTDLRWWLEARWYSGEHAWHAPTWEFLSLCVKHPAAKAWTNRWIHQCSPSGALFALTWAWWCSLFWNGMFFHEFCTKSYVGFTLYMLNVKMNITNSSQWSNPPILLRFGSGEGILGNSWIIRRTWGFGCCHEGISSNLCRAVSLAGKGMWTKYIYGNAKYREFRYIWISTCYQQGHVSRASCIPCGSMWRHPHQDFRFK